MVEGVEGINRDFQATSCGLGVAAPAFGSAEIDPLCKMKVDTGVTRPCSRIASDSRGAGGRHQIAVVKIAGGDIEGDSGTQVNNCPSPDSPVDTVGADQVETVAAVGVSAAAFRTQVIGVGRRGSKSTGVDPSFCKKVLGEGGPSVSSGGLQAPGRTVAAGPP